MSAVLPLSNNKPVDYQTAMAKALQLISAFNMGPVKKSTHYPHLSKQEIIRDLKDTINNVTPMLAQKGSSLCGPAAFFFVLVRLRPDLYVQTVIDLYKNGKTQIKTLKLQSSKSAKQYRPVRIREADWLLLSSIKPNYDHPDEQFDGITLPGKLKGWFLDAGFTTAEDKTNLMFNKGLDTLLQAQIDYKSGHAICLFVDADVFSPFNLKTGSSTFPNHWVVMTSDIKIRQFDQKTQKLSTPAMIDQSIVKTIKKEIHSKEMDAILEDRNSVSTETKHKILLDAFTWGNIYTPVTSKISATQDARLTYFLKGFYGYIKIKR